MGYVNVDIVTLQDLNLSDDQLKMFLEYLAKIEFALADFEKSVLRNIYVCPSCCLRKYAKLSLTWTSVIASVLSFREYKGNINSIFNEFLLSTYFCSAAAMQPELVIEYGSEQLKILGIKDKNINLLRLFGMMMNLFIKETLKKILDNFTDLLYDMDVNTEQVHCLMNLLLESMLTLVGRFVHIYDENLHAGVVQIHKTSSRNVEGLACEEPLIIEYFYKKGTPNE